MVTMPCWKSFAFFLLSVLVIASVVEARVHWPRQHRDAKCNIYNAEWKCDASQVFHSGKNPLDVPWVPQEGTKNCTTDLVGTTNDLMKEGDDKIELTENGDAVLLIGDTGTGKSTLTYFLAGNNSALVSYYVDYFTNLIKDCNDKIGDSTIVSQTIFPDLVVEAVTRTNFYDNPGFEDTRDACIEIANAYFITKVVNNLKRVKFVIVSNHAAIIPTAARGEFIGTLKNVLSFIPNMTKFLPSVALIGTKVDSTSEEEVFQRVNQMSQFLTKNKPNLHLEFSEPTLTMVNNLFDTLNETSADGSFKRINVFRVPKECGPLSDIEHMQKNRADIMNIVMNNLNYTEISPSDFGISLSSDALLVINDVAAVLSTRAKSSLLDLTQALNATKLEEIRPLGVHKKLETLKSYISQVEGAVTRLKNSGFQNGSIKTQTFIQNLLDEFVQLGLANSTAQNYSTSLLGPFKFFDSMGRPSFINSGDLVPWLAPLTNFQAQMLNEEDWNDFLISLWTDLSHIDVHSSAVGDKYDLKTWWQSNNKITLTTFSSFWREFNGVSAMSNRKEDDITPILHTDTADKLKNLNDLLGTSLGNSFDCHLDPSNSSISLVTGNFVTVSDILTKTSCLTSGTKMVKVFAAHTIFIDQDFNGTKESGPNSVDLTIISPTLWYYTSKMISLDGGNGLPGVFPGGPGKPGGRAGNLISIGQKFTGTIRNFANGGKGGDGAKGQNGEDGTDGSRKDLFTDEDDSDRDSAPWYPPADECDAGSGKIKPKSYFTPYWCNDFEDDDWCHADDEGAIVIIEGAPGTQGKEGGHGGQSGLGGKGGHLYTIQVESGSPEDTPGANGPTGQQGVGGEGGEGGHHGDEIWAEIDDVQKHGKKWCKVVDQQYQGGGSPAPDGRNGITGGNPNGPDQPDQQNFDPASVRKHFSDFKTSVVGVESNQFLSDIITQFKSKGDQALPSIFSI